MNETRWAKMIHAFPEKTVGVLGDFMLDEFLRGEATRISPEAPVPVVRVDHPAAAAAYLGGAGNVAANIAALGGRPIPWGVIGTDESGQKLLRLMKKQGIRYDTLVREPGRLTPRKVRIVAHQHQLLRLDFEKPQPLSPHSSARLVHSFSHFRSRLDALIISDYQKGSVIAELCKRLLVEARAERIPVFVDPKPAQWEAGHHATVVTPNLHEAEVMADVPMRTPRQIELGGRYLLKKLACKYLLITRGSEGMTLFSPDGRISSIPSVPSPVYDVTGAGDTVIAVLALAYSSGATMQEAAELANVAAGRVVLKFGTSQITAEELLGAVMLGK
ncbi:MAG: bifunctional heptose 7-phosphate kinase/heptose 1-phosphate adenyltransferase [Terriglobia bacterium]